MWISGNSRRAGSAATDKMIAIHPVGNPRRTHRGRNQRIQVLLLQGGVDTFGTGQASGTFPGLNILRRVEWPLLLGALKQLLGENRFVISSALCRNEGGLSSCAERRISDFFMMDIAEPSPEIFRFAQDDR